MSADELAGRAWAATFEGVLDFATGADQPPRRRQPRISGQGDPVSPTTAADIAEEVELARRLSRIRS
jgi:hypothetical protein